jgi:outer membrane receptor protein involved in Fe transport
MPVRALIRVYILMVSLLTGGTVGIYAQNQTIVAGRVLTDGRPVEYATIAVYTISDTGKIINATITDSLGRFSFRDLASSWYMIKISLQGYLPQKQLFTIDSSHPNVLLRDIELPADVKSLKAVVVIAHANQLKKTTSGFIMSAGSNITQATGTATDLLRSTPTVVVDEDGNITIRGKAPLILINGRNSNLSATDRIPASSVESIEIINNPSANYDADAEGGIINIRLKKNVANGTNGSFALGGGAGSGSRFSSAFIINHQKGKWNTGLAYDNRFAHRTRDADAGRTNFHLPNEYNLLQNRHDTRFEQTQNLKANVDYTPTKRDLFSLELIGNISGEDNHETLVSLMEKKSGAFNYKNSRHSDEFERGKAVEGAFNYNRKFDSQNKTLSLGVSTSFNFDRENTGIATQSLDTSNAPVGAPFLQRTHNYQNSNVTNFRVDFSTPLGQKGVMGIGYKGIARMTDAEFQSLYGQGTEYVPDLKASNLFDFSEQIHAVYFTYQNSIGAAEASKVKYDLGLRGEQVWNKGNSATRNIGLRNQYFNLFPSATFAFYLQEADFFKLTYSRRINRPGLGQLNPFIDITDSLNPHSGNPYLKPELVHSLELGYNKEGSKFSSATNLFYRYSSNIIRSFISLDTNGVALAIPQNYGNAVTYGLEGVLSARPTRFYNCDASLSMYRQNFSGANVSDEALSENFSWYAKLINNFTMWKGSKMQLILNYNSPIATPQGTRIAVYNADGGFQQKLFKGKAALGLVVTDIFNTQRNGITAITSDFIYYRNFKVDTRAVLLTFTYSFRSLAKEELLENKFEND